MNSEFRIQNSQTAFRAALAAIPSCIPAVAAFVFVCAASVGNAADQRVVQAARSGDAATVRALIRQRADVNAAEVDGTTALHWATWAGDADLVTALLRAGAKA